MVRGYRYKVYYLICNIHIHKTIILYTWNLHCTCQLHLNEAGWESGKKARCEEWARGEEWREELTTYLQRPFQVLSSTLYILGWVLCDIHSPSTTKWQGEEKEERHKLETDSGNNFFKALILPILSNNIWGDKRHSQWCLSDFLRSWGWNVRLLAYILQILCLYSVTLWKPSNLLRVWPTTFKGPWAPLTKGKGAPCHSDDTCQGLLHYAPESTDTNHFLMSENQWKDIKVAVFMGEMKQMYSVWSEPPVFIHSSNIYYTPMCTKHYYASWVR